MATLDFTTKPIVQESSVTGNRTPVSRVTGGDTSHYTMTDVLLLLLFDNCCKSMLIFGYTKIHINFFYENLTKHSCPSESLQFNQWMDDDIPCAHTVTSKTSSSYINIAILLKVKDRHLQHQQSIIRFIEASALLIFVFGDDRRDASSTYLCNHTNNKRT